MQEEVTPAFLLKTGITREKGLVNFLFLKVNPSTINTHVLVEKGEAGSCYNMQSSRNRYRLLVADSRFPHSAVLAFAGTAIVCILPKIQVSKTVLSRSKGAACGDKVLKGLKQSYSIGLDIRPPS